VHIPSLPLSLTGLCLLYEAGSVAIFRCHLWLSAPLCCCAVLVVLDQWWWTSGGGLLRGLDLVQHQ